MSLLIFYLIVSIGVSFVCSLLESSILSVSPAFIAVLEKDKHPRGPLLRSLKENIDRPLAAILTLNTIANTTGAAGVGAQVLIVYGSEALALSSGLLTFTILVFSEIIPKTLGAVHAKALAPFSAVIIKYLIYVTYPFVVMSEYLHDFLDSDENSSSITREEMMVTAELGADEGAIRRNESTVIQNLLTLNKLEVTDIMTPRSVIFALDQKMNVGQVFEEHKNLEFSRIPVYNDTLDDVTGFVLRYKLMEAYSQDLDDWEIEKLSNPLHTVPETISVAACMDQFIKRKEHIFLVVNEYGSPDGIVTLEDVVETLLGVEIVDETDSVEDLRKHARELWLTRKNKMMRPERKPTTTQS
jgi:CBS domain containing-hemolysin-like protein